MSRHAYGGALTDWVFTADTDDKPILTGLATVTFWNAQTGGTQYTDLTANALTDAGAGEFDHVTSSDGSDGYTLGTIPQFFGPHEVFQMWASANGGDRLLIMANDIGDVFGTLANDTANSLTSHIASANGHTQGLNDHTDVDVSGVSNGDFLAYSTAVNKWVALSATGLNPADFVKTAGTSTIRIPDGNVTDFALEIRIPAGARTTAPDTLSFYWNAGTDGAPSWQQTSRFNEFGELRLQSSANDRVAERVKQFSTSLTANLTEWTTPGNVPISWVSANGRGRFPNVGHVLAFSVLGNISVATGAHRIYNDTGVDLVIRAVRASLGTAPTTQSAIFDVNKGGATIFGTQANRPTIPAGQNTNKTTGMTVTNLADGEYLTVDVDQIGSGTVGANLIVQVLCS